MSAEKRIDPEDKAAYTFEEISTFYKGKYKKAEIKDYWETMKPAKKGKAEAKAKGKAEAKAKGKAKAKAKAKADAGGKKGPAGPADPKYPTSLLPAPETPKYKIVVIGYTAPGGWEKNTDKDKTGFRYDSTPIANGVINAGCSCDLVDYTPDKPKAFAKKVAKYDGMIVRINPGQLGAGQQVFDDLMMSFVKKGVPVWSSPAVQTQLGAKDALVKIKDMNSGLPDTLAYYDEESLKTGFKKTCAFQPRVIKQNRGSAGEGIWLCWLEGKSYCKKYGDASLDDGDKLKLMEMNDNHVEYHTVGEFLEFCVNGPGGKAGEWKSTFPGKYLEGGKEAGGQLVDQRLLPRIKEGEVRMQMVKDELFAIIHKKPQEGGLSAVGGIADYTFYEPNDPKYADLKDALYKDIPKMMEAMGLAGEPLPVLWTADYIPVDDHVAPMVVGEFNCSCVGISAFLKACGPDKDLKDVSFKDFEYGMKLTNLIGKKVVETIDELKTKTTKPKYPLSLLPPPKKPRYNLVVVGYTAPGGWEKNTDKDKTGFRYDSTPIANGCILAGAACDLIDYTPEDPKGFEEKASKYDGIIVRINPGQLGGGQQVFDDLMMSFVKKGVPVWSSPAVQTQLGAKDALVKIKDMNSGLPDTLAYYDEEALKTGFKKTCAFQPRVIKQNRGSAGEGIWLCWLQDKEYCKNYGDASLNDGDKLKLMEMNDNHVEYKTVGEFLEFCVRGPGGKAGEWKSTFPGKYLEGGKEAGGQLVDQRLLPRIKEGEVRMQMVKDELFAIIHKKPQEGGLSAVGGIADYTFYGPNDKKYADLKKALYKDIPKMMEAMGLGGEPLPVLWTADYIPVDDHVAPMVVGEFNCSCVGISAFLKACGPDKDLNDVSFKDFEYGMKLTKLIGKKAIETLNQLKKK